MRDIPKHIDDFFFDSFFGVQAFTNLVERWTGMKYYDLARVIFAAFVASWLWFVFRAITYAANTEGWNVQTTMVTYGIVTFFIVPWYFHIRRWSLEAKRATSRGFRNPFRERPISLLIRNGISVFCLMDLFVISTNTGNAPIAVMWPFMWGMVYVISCDEAPPQTDVSYA